MLPPCAGHQLGTIGSYLLCPLLISHLGWESVFWIFGSLGFVWLLGWLPLVPDGGPAAQASLSAAAASRAAEAAALEKSNKELRLQDVPWAAFATNPAFWAIVAAQCTVSVGNVLAFRQGSRGGGARGRWSAPPDDALLRCLHASLRLGQATVAR